MSYAAIISVVVQIVEVAGPLVLKLLLTLVGIVWLRNFLGNAAHWRDFKLVNKAHRTIMAAYSRIGPLRIPPLEVYWRYAQAHGVVDPTPSVDPNDHVLRRRHIPSRPEEFLPPEDMPRVQQLRVTNGTGYRLQLTCQQAPGFERWLSRGQTVPLPTSIKSLATVTVETIHEDFTPVKLVHNVDLHQVSRIHVEEANGIIQVLACAGQTP